MTFFWVFFEFICFITFSSLLVKHQPCQIQLLIFVFFYLFLFSFSHCSGFFSTIRFWTSFHLRDAEKFECKQLFPILNTYTNNFPEFINNKQQIFSTPEISANKPLKLFHPSPSTAVRHSCSGVRGFNDISKISFAISSHSLAFPSDSLTHLQQALHSKWERCRRWCRAGTGRQCDLTELDTTHSYTEQTQFTTTIHTPLSTIRNGILSDDSTSILEQFERMHG